MANINPYVEKILSARYGEEVRGSIASALKETYNDAAILPYGLNTAFNDSMDFLKKLVNVKKITNITRTTSFGINDKGTGVSDSRYDIYRCPVTPNSYIYVDAPENLGDYCTYVFKTNFDASIENNVGQLHFEARKGILKVPSEATYIHLTVPTRENTCRVYEVYPEVKDFAKFIQGRVDRIDINVSGNDVTFSLSATNAMFYCTKNEPSSTSITDTTHTNFFTLNGTITSTTSAMGVDPRVSGIWILAIDVKNGNQLIARDDSRISEIAKREAVPIAIYRTYNWWTDFDFKTNVGSRFNHDVEKNKKYILSGTIFMWFFEDTLYVRTVAPYIYLGGSGFTKPDPYVTIKITNSVIYNNGYVIASGESPYYKVVAYNEVKEDDLLLAMIYWQGGMRSLHPNVIANKLPITTIRQREGVPIHINFDRLGYFISPRRTLGRETTPVTYCGDFLILNDMYNADDGEKLGYCQDFLYVQDPNILYQKNTSNLSGKKILTIGDSITARGWYQHQMQTRNSGLIFVGTQNGQYHTDIKCEGYPGWKVSQIVSNQGPFWNSSTGKVDFANYVRTTGNNPDIVTIEFGLNESGVDPVTWRNDCQSLIDSIKSYNSGIHVFVLTPFDRAKLPQMRLENKNVDVNSFYTINRLQMACWTLKDCELIPTHFIFNDQYDYILTEIDYGYGTDKIKVTSDNVHPKDTTGFYKLGDMIYNYIQ